MRLLLLANSSSLPRPDGRVGVMEHRCPHRCASLFFGRNEEGGCAASITLEIRTSKATASTCRTVPPAQDFKHRVKAKAYKVVERGGFIWTSWAHAPKRRRLPTRSAAAARGGALHARSHSANALVPVARRRHRHLAFRLPAYRRLKVDDVDPNTHPSLGRGRPRARLQATETEWGTNVRGLPPAEPGEVLLPFRPFHVPFITLTPNGSFEDQVACTLNVPMDDTHHQ